MSVLKRFDFSLSTFFCTSVLPLLFLYELQQKQNLDMHWTQTVWEFLNFKQSNTDYKITRIRRRRSLFSPYPQHSKKINFLIKFLERKIQWIEVTNVDINALLIHATKVANNSFSLTFSVSRKSDMVKITYLTSQFFFYGKFQLIGND